MRSTFELMLAAVLLILLGPLGNAKSADADGSASQDANQDTIIFEIRKLGASVRIDKTSPGNRVIEVEWRDATDAGLEHLKGMKQLQKLDLYGTRVTDAGLEHLKGM